MLSFLWSLGAFIVALGILVAVHEWGHFIVARLCGVHVERFSIGFGKPFFKRTDKKGTEFALAAIPLGGYVRMLDERVEAVPDELKHKAFNNKPVLQRMAIIAAGPFINFVFAVFALYVMFLIGQQTVRPVVGTVEPASIAAKTDLQPGETITAVGGRDTADWESVNLEFVSAIGQPAVEFETQSREGRSHHYILQTAGWNFDPEKQSALTSLGITPFRPKVTTTVAFVGEDSPAEHAGLKVGDSIETLDGKPVTSWQLLVKDVQNMPGKSVDVGINRDGQSRVINATIARRDTDEGQDGYLGVSPQMDPWPDEYVFTQQFGPIEAVGKAADKTWRLMAVSVQMLGKLVTGDVSLNNLSGPISIAQGAGASAGYGLAYFLSFLALISVSLGIINLLPIPMLDGGHLLFYFVEWVTGKPVPDTVQEWGFRFGGALLFMMMSIAIINDISRIA